MIDAIENHIQHGYPLSLRELLREGAPRVAGSRWVVLLGAVLWLSVLLLVSTFTALLGVSDSVSSALAVLATTPISVALAMAGVQRARGELLSVASLGRYRSATPNAAIVLLLGVLIPLGSEALFGPSLALGVSLVYGLFTSLALYLVADRGFDAFAAIRTSFLLVRHRWARLLALQALLGLALVVAAIPFGLGLIWALPWTLIVLAGAYLRATEAAPAVAGAPAGDAPNASDEDSVG